MASAGAVANQIRQRELLGAIHTIYEASGWHVIDLHMNKTNPAAMSGPDFLMLRSGTMRAVKGLAKGELSGPQEKMKAEYTDCGCEWRTYYPHMFRDIADDAE